jgi:pimeloyl-ACP methyl ester carboxylesterase
MTEDGPPTQDGPPTEAEPLAEDGPPRRIVTADGLTLAVVTAGDPAHTPVLLVHGYPDTHRVWDHVADALAADHYVIRYDVRGAGASGHPAGLDGYTLDRLADDLFRVISAVSPQRPVHVAGHDWGSIQSWEAVTDSSRAAGRIASFTSISGPCLDHAGFWFRDRLAHRTPRGLAQYAAQSVRSWYIGAFRMPVLAPLTWRVWLARAWPTVLRRLEGVTPREGHPAPTLADDAVAGINLYRANMRQRLRNPRSRPALMPVQLITVTGDHYVGPALAGADLDRWVPDLSRRTVRGSHWSVLEGKGVAKLIREFAGRAERGGGRRAAAG